MPFPQKFLLLSKKTLFVAIIFSAFKKIALAGAATAAVNSFGVISERANYITLYQALVVCSGALMGASIFWWRRDKSKADATDNKGKGENSRRAQAKNAANSLNQDDSTVNADVANWVRSNISNKKSFDGQQQDLSKRQSSKSAVARAQTVNLFRLPAPLPPIKALPTLNDQSLLEAVEQIHDFDATEEQREVAINIILTFKSTNAVDALAQVAHYDESSRLRIIALNGLGEFNHESVFEPVLLTCADPAREVRAAAARTLARLSVNRAEAYTRIVESKDSERLRLASMVCIDAGLATHALARLAHYDNQQANDAFAMVRLLTAAEQFAPITKAISDSSDARPSLIMIKALKAIKPVKMLSALSHLTNNAKLSIEVKRALRELITELNEA